MNTNSPNNYEQDNSENDDIEIRPPDKTIREKLVDDGYPDLTIDEELYFLRELNNAEGEDRKKIKKMLNDTKIMDSMERNINYDEDINNILENNKNDDDEILLEVLKKSEEEYMNNLLLQIKEQEREAEEIKNIIEKNEKTMIKKNNELSRLIMVISQNIKLSNKINDEYIILSILEDYIKNYDEKLLLEEKEYDIFKNYLKEKYEKYFLLGRRTFLKKEEYDFLNDIIEKK